MNIPLINNANVNEINTAIIAIKKNLQKTSSGAEKLQDVDVDVNVNIAHNSLYCAADSTVIKGASLFQGCSIKIMFTSAITGSDSSTPLIINYNDVNIPVKTGKNGALADFVAYNIGSGFVYCQAYTTLELAFDGTQFIIIGNPVVISNSDYTIYTDGSIIDFANNVKGKRLKFNDVRQEFRMTLPLQDGAHYRIFFNAQFYNATLSYYGDWLFGKAGNSIQITQLEAYGVTFNYVDNDIVITSTDAIAFGCILAIQL